MEYASCHDALLVAQVCNALSGEEERTACLRRNDLQTGATQVGRAPCRGDGESQVVGAWLKEPARVPHDGVQGTVAFRAPSRIVTD